MSATQSWLIAVGSISRARFGIDRQVVPRVGRDHKCTPPYAEQIVFPHHPQHALVIDVEAPPLQFGGDSSIAICRRFQRDLLHLIAQFHLDRRGLPRHAPAVETGPAQAGHLTQRAHGLAFRRGLLDFFKQASAPLTTAGG